MLGRLGGMCRGRDGERRSTGSGLRCWGEEDTGMNSLAEGQAAGLEAVRGLCRDLGGVEDEAEATATAERWVRLAARDDPKVVLVRPDPAGRPRVAAWGS